VSVPQCSQAGLRSEITSVGEMRQEPQLQLGGIAPPNVTHVDPGVSDMIAYTQHDEKKRRRVSSVAVQERRTTGGLAFNLVQNFVAKFRTLVLSPPRAGGWWCPVP